jgi:hypothetical protein
MKSKNLLFLLAFATLTSSLHLSAQWQPLGGAGFTGTDVAHTSITITGSSTPVVGFRDNGFAGGKLSVMEYTGSSWTSLGNAGFSPGNVTEVWMTSDSATGTPHVAYLDSLSGLTVAKYNGTSWGFIGGSSIASGTPDQILLVIAGNGTPYLGYRDASGTSKTNVKKYSGGSWSSVGSANFSGAAEGVSFAVDHQGVPYSAASLTGGLGMQVQKFNGSNWVNVGNPGFDTALTLTKVSIAVGANNQPYVALTKSTSPNQIVLWTYNGSAWVQVGGNVTTTRGQGVALVISKQGRPYIAYDDFGVSNKATVAYLNGSTWSTFGNADFSGSTAKSLSLAINNAGDGYVAYQDLANSSAATVQKISHVTGIEETGGLTEFKIYPNPSSGKFQINYKSAQAEEVQLSITNMMGQPVWQETRTNSNGTEFIDLTGVAVGLYTLQVKTNIGIENRLVEIR